MAAGSSKTNTRRQDNTDPALQQPRFGRSIRAKRIRRRIAAVLAVLFVLSVAAFVVGAILVMSPNIQTQAAIPATMTDYISADGFVVLSTVPVESQGSGFLYYSVTSGQRVRAEALVADVYASRQGVEARSMVEQIDAELAQLETAQNTYVESGDIESLLQQRQAGVYNLLNAMDADNYANIDAPFAEVTLASNKLQVATGENVDFSSRAGYLTSQRESYQSRNTPVGAIYAPDTGYFVPSGKYDQIVPAYETLTEASPATLGRLLETEPQYFGENVIAHIVNDYKWHFFTTVPLADAGKFTVGKKLEISFPDYGETAVPVKVESIVEDEDTGVAKIELLCEYINPQILTLRHEKANIIFSTQRGLRIDKRALRVKDGEYGVFIRVGNIVRYRRIEILLEDDHYILIPLTVTAGVNEVTLYDDVIVDNGGLELYDQRIL